MTGHAFDRSKQRISRRRAKASGLLGFAAAAALPVVLWHHAIGLLASGFHPTIYYFVTGWTPFGLMALGLLLFVPVVSSNKTWPLDSVIWTYSIPSWNHHLPFSNRSLA